MALALWLTFQASPWLMQIGSPKTMHSSAGSYEPPPRCSPFKPGPHIIFVMLSRTCSAFIIPFQAVVMGRGSQSSLWPLSACKLGFQRCRPLNDQGCRIIGSRGMP